MATKILIGDFLHRIKRPVALNPSKKYKLVTIKMKHKGVILREEKLGSDIKSNMYEVKAGDFILSGIDARNGAFGIVPPELDGAIVTNDFWYFDINESIVDKELFLELTSTSWFDEICRKGSDGTTQRIRLQKSKFYNQTIFLPSREEQTYFIERFKEKKYFNHCLSQELSQQHTLITKLRQQILQSAIDGNLTADWRNDAKNITPASELLKRLAIEKKRLLKDTKGNNQKNASPSRKIDDPFLIPKTWEWTKLIHICSKTGSGSTPRGGKTAYTKEGIKFIRSQNVFDGELCLQDVVHIDHKTHEKMKGTKVQGDDLLLNITGGSIGRCALVPKNFDTANISQHVAIIRSIDPQIATYLHKVIISDYFQKKIIEEQTGAGREGLPKNKMDELLIPLPPLEEQEVIVAKVERLFALCNQFEIEIAQNRKYTDQLMQALLKEAFEQTEHRTDVANDVIELKHSNIDKPDIYKRTLLAAEIVDQLHNEPTFGHLKLQKIIFLCQKTQKMQLPTNFLQQAAGPYDPEMARSLDKQLKEKKWFDYDKSSALKYRPLKNVGTHKSEFQKYFQNDLNGIKHIIALFKTKKSTEMEAVATLYACWEEILHSNEHFTKNLLLKKFYEWSEEKRKFSERQLNQVISWMEKHGIYPEHDTATKQMH